MKYECFEKIATLLISSYEISYLQIWNKQYIILLPLFFISHDLFPIDHIADFLNQINWKHFRSDLSDEKSSMKDFKQNVDVYNYAPSFFFNKIIIIV